MTGRNVTNRTRRKDSAIGLLLQGKTDEEVARRVGVSRETMNRWRNHDPEFIAKFETLQELHEDLLLKQHLLNTSKSGIESNLMALTTEATLALQKALSNSDPRTYREECARAKIALELLQVIGIKEYAIKTVYKHTNQDDGLMSIVDLAKIAESYKMEAELEDELLRQL